MACCLTLNFVVENVEHVAIPRALRCAAAKTSTEDAAKVCAPSCRSSRCDLGTHLLDPVVGLRHQTLDPLLDQPDGDRHGVEVVIRAPLGDAVDLLLERGHGFQYTINEPDNVLLLDVEGLHLLDHLVLGDVGLRPRLGDKGAAVCKDALDLVARLLDLALLDGDLSGLDLERAHGVGKAGMHGRCESCSALPR